MHEQQSGAPKYSHATSAIAQVSLFYSMHLRAWRSHGLAYPGISPPVSHHCFSPSRGSSDGGDETNWLWVPAAPAPGLTLSLGAHAPSLGAEGMHQGSPPTMSLHGEPTVPSLQRDSSWTPPGSICFRLEPLSSPKADSPCQGQFPRRMLVLPCLFSGFLSRLLPASDSTDASRKTPLPHDKGMCTGRFCSCGDLVQCLSLVPSAPGAAGDTFTKSWPAAGPGSRHAAIPAKVSCLCEISTNKCYNYTQPTTGLLANT